MKNPDGNIEVQKFGHQCVLLTETETKIRLHQYVRWIPVVEKNKKTSPQTTSADELDPPFAPLKTSERTLKWNWE